MRHNMNNYSESIINIKQRISEISNLPFDRIKKEAINNPFLKNESEFSNLLKDSVINQTGNSNEKKRNSIDGIIEKQAAKTGIDPALIKAVIKAESNFNQKAVSPKGALGLMQLMPDTASDLGVTNPMDPEQNITGGTEYLKNMILNFGQVEKALAAYNAGPNAVNKYKGIPPYKETKEYIEKVGNYYNSFKHEK